MLGWRGGMGRTRNHKLEKSEQFLQLLISNRCIIFHTLYYLYFLKTSSLLIATEFTSRKQASKLLEMSHCDGNLPAFVWQTVFYSYSEQYKPREDKKKKVVQSFRALL